MSERSSSDREDLVQDLLNQMPSVNVSQAQVDRLAQFIRATSRAASYPSLHAAPADDSHGPYRFTRILSAKIRIVYAAALLLVIVLGGAIAVSRFLLPAAELEWTADHVLRSESGQIAYLVARNGRTVHAWGTSVPNGILAGKMIAAANSAGRGDLAILGFSQGAANPFPHQFAAYRIKQDLQKPWWTIELKNTDIPADLLARPGRTYDGNQFVARVCESADIFPERAGDELIVVFQHAVYSQCVLQVRDLDGQLLYQAWHDGNINDIHWMSDAKLLVCSGMNSEVDGVERGLSHAWHPYVVFAIRPLSGETEPRWVNTVDHDGGVDPDWYLCLIEPEAAPQPEMIRLTNAYGGEDSQSNVAFNVDFMTPVGRAGFSIQIDQHGIAAPGPLLTSDAYKRAVKKNYMPPADAYRLDRLPPIQDRRDIWIPGAKTSGTP